MKLTKTREKLIEMYISALNENEIPWEQQWHNGINKNGITNREYNGINQLILSFTSYFEKYTDSRWLTYLQIKNNGYKLADGKGKGVPVEFWSVYDKKNKKNISYEDYEDIIKLCPDLKENFVIYNKTVNVFNGDLIVGLPKETLNNKKIEPSHYISNLIKKMDVKYSEKGNKALYRPRTDEIVLPPSHLFFDKYSYYATQLHELCHATGNKKRLNRDFSNDEENYAREELVAEISSSFLMPKINIDVKAVHYENHKRYIQYWIKILKEQPAELFKAINEAKKVCDYIDNITKSKTKKYER